MRIVASFGCVLMPLAGGPALAAPAEHVGSWLLFCPAETPHEQSCILRHDKRFLDTAGITGDLEVQALGKILVPVLTLRGVPTEALLAAAASGTAEASLQFPGGGPQPLICGLTANGYVCAPGSDTGQKIAAAFPAAASVTVRIAVTISGIGALPPQQRSLDLSGTDRALLRLRAVGPMPVPGLTIAAQSQRPVGMLGLADKWLKHAGYATGVAGLQALIAKYKDQ